MHQIGELAALTFLCVVAVSLASPAPFSWTRTQTLRKEDGQPSYNFSDSVSSLGTLLAIGSSSANRGRGEVTIYSDRGGGLKQIAIVRNPSGGIIGENFGAQCLLFNYNGFTQVAVAAPQEMSGTGLVHIFQQRVDNFTLWDFMITLSPPTGTYVTNFGRKMIYDGSQLIISAERVYKSGRRFVVTAINVIGTSDFIQSDGIEDTIGGDPLLIYRSVQDRNSQTYLTYYSTISDADYSYNTGASVSLSGDLMAVGASFREQLKYGSGTDGDLDITDTKLLDGTASYNFNNIIIRSGGVLTVDHFDTIRNLGGVMTVKIKNRLYIEKGGLINLTAAGYKGGRTSFTGTASPQKGAGPGGGGAAASQFVGVFSCDYSSTVAIGISLTSVMASVNKLSVNQSLPFAEACGGGGGYGTKGKAGVKVACGTSGLGGVAYGDPTMAVLYRGSGGGSGFPWQVGAGGAGGDGGGIIHIAAKQIINYGTIQADGGPGSDGGFFSGAGGGGSGGSILLIGDNLANYGLISAVGGKAGVRALGSGSGGDTGVTGGNGGYGRIKFDFLQTQAHGIVKPRPVNITTYLGNVLLYKRNASTKVWQLLTYLPRIPAFQFVGHSVALNGKILAVASTQGTPVTPLEQVFLIDVSTIINSSSPFTYHVLNSPNPTQDRLFGYQMTLNNNTLVVTARGTQDTRGIAYVYQSRDFIHHIGNPLLNITTNTPAAGDAFASNMALDFPNLYLQLPRTQDETLPVNLHRSNGSVMLYKYIRAISVANSYVTCDFTTVTANVTLNCTVHMFASDNYVAGDLVDIPRFSPTVDFQSIGVFTFQVKFTTVGLNTIQVTYNSTALPTITINVTNAIIPSQSSLSCPVLSFVAGTSCTCYLYTNAGSGEMIARKEFDVIVWNMDDDLAIVEQHGTVATSFGQLYKNLPSQAVVSLPNESDYRTMMPFVNFVSEGVYSVNFTTWRPGTYGVFALYQNTPLKFPNPAIVDATLPSVNTTQSVVVCPYLSPPNRTMICILHLISSTGITTDIPSFEKQLVLPNTTRAGFNNLSTYPVSVINSNEGRYSLFVVPDRDGNFTVNITINGLVVPMQPAFVNITEVAPVRCREYPRIFNSFSIFNQAMLARADVSLYGSSATQAVYSNGVGFCDDPKV